jgi:hypothetical protein
MAQTFANQRRNLEPGPWFFWLKTRKKSVASAPQGLQNISGANNAFLSPLSDSQLKQVTEAPGTVAHLMRSGTG